MTKQLNPAALAQFTGTENWYRHAINRKVLFTDGAKYVADQAAAYWLLDEIALIQPYNSRIAAESFQVWKLKVNGDHPRNSYARTETTISSSQNTSRSRTSRLKASRFGSPITPSCFRASIDIAAGMGAACRCKLAGGPLQMLRRAHPLVQDAINAHRVAEHAVVHDMRTDLLTSCIVNGAVLV